VHRPLPSVVPVTVRLRPNEHGIAYIGEAGTVADHRDSFPDSADEDRVFAVAISAPGLRALLPNEACEYFYEDYFLWDASSGKIIAFDFREDFGAENCASHYQGRYLIAVSAEQAMLPGFGLRLVWDSMVIMNDSYYYADSHLFYVGEQLFGID
jgi:hypothetical protein